MPILLTLANPPMFPPTPPIDPPPSHFPTSALSAAFWICERLVVGRALRWEGVQGPHNGANAVGRGAAVVTTHPL